MGDLQPGGIKWLHWAKELYWLFTGNLFGDAGSLQLMENALAATCRVGWEIQAELSYFVFILVTDLTRDFIL